MLRVERFVNELMSSNCYIVWDDLSLKCLVIDPASEKSLREIDFIESHNLTLDYILLTHEHTDHTWGVNTLLDRYSSAQVICTETCKHKLPNAGDTYFRLYYEWKEYSYEVRQVDHTCEELDWHLQWNDINIKFINTPGHSLASMCVEIEGWLFSGDTLMQYKPMINKRDGSKELYSESIKMLNEMYSRKGIKVFPGHGEIFGL